eukprot:9499697-Pyramimonas_sp.AAC.1
MMKRIVPVLCFLGVRRIAREQPGQCLVPNNVAGIERGMRSPALSLHEYGERLERIMHLVTGY